MTVVITYPENLENEHEVIHALLEEGLECLHIRKPLMNELDYKAFINKIETRYHSKLVLHQHHHLENEYSIKGIHGKIEGSISCSMHSLEEIENEGAFYEYVFLSPVYDSISKDGYTSDFNHDAVKHFLSISNNRPQVIALGGLDEKNVAHAHEMGFDGVALLGAIWEFYLMHGINETLTKFKLIKNYWGKTIDHIA
jgi:thiamine-phosphate pyrophosphorylase